MTADRSAPGPLGLPASFWFLWSGALINRLGTFVGPFLALWLTQERGLSLPQAGGIVSLLGLGSFAATSLGGLLADRIGRRATLALGLALSAGAMLHLLVARGLFHLAVAALLLGAVADMYRPALNAATADLVPPQDRQRAFGLLYWAANLGFAFSLPLGGAASTSSFTLLFLADAATNLIFAGLVLWRVPESRPQAAARQGSSLATPLRNRTFVGFCGLNLITAVVYGQASVAMPLAMRSQGLTSAQYGWLLSINGALIVLLQPFAERLLGGLPAARRLASGVAVVGFGFGLQSLCAAPAPYAAAIAIWTLGEIGLAGTGPAVVAQLSPPHLRGAYQGLFQMSWSGSALIAPLVGPALLAARGPVWLWLGCAAGCAAAAGGFLALGRRLEQPTPAAALRSGPGYPPPP